MITLKDAEKRAILQWSKDVMRTFSEGHLEIAKNTFLNIIPRYEWDGIEEIDRKEIDNWEFSYYDIWLGKPYGSVQISRANTVEEALKDIEKFFS